MHHVLPDMAHCDTEPEEQGALASITRPATLADPRLINATLRALIEDREFTLAPLQGIKI